jgi:SlyX protein
MTPARANDAGAVYPSGETETTMTTPADRLTTLEIRNAEQEKAIDELSGQLAEQWKVVDRLQKKLDALTERFLSLEESSAPDVPVTKPPHW